MAQLLMPYVNSALEHVMAMDPILTLHNTCLLSHAPAVLDR